MTNEYGKHLILIIDVKPAKIAGDTEVIELVVEGYIGVIWGQVLKYKLFRGKSFS